MNKLATAALAAGAVAALASCSLLKQATYEEAAIEGFASETLGIDPQFSELTEGGILAADDPAEIGGTFEPSECVAVFKIADLLTPADVGAYVGNVVGYSIQTDDPATAYLAAARHFDSDAGAQEFVDTLPATLEGCAGGYTFIGTDWAWQAQSITARTVAFDGFGDVLVIDERGGTDTYSDGTVVEWGGYATYVGAHGNVVFLAAYLYNDGDYTEADVEAGFAEFAAHLDSTL